MRQNFGLIGKIITLVILFLTVSISGFTQGSVIQGQVTYGNLVSTPLSGVILTFEDQAGTILGTATTSSSGNYSFTVNTPGTITIKTSSTATPGGFN